MCGRSLPQFCVDERLDVAVEDALRVGRGHTRSGVLAPLFQVVCWSPSTRRPCCVDRSMTVAVLTRSTVVVVLLGSNSAPGAARRAAMRSVPRVNESSPSVRG